MEQYRIEKSRLEKSRKKKNRVEKIKSLFTSDPKPIFDHFRNMGIAVALALGARALQNVNFDANPYYLNDIVMGCSIIIFVLVVALLIINTSFAQVSLNFFFFKKTKFEGLAQNLFSGLVIYSYTIIIAALAVMYSFNASNNQIEKTKQQEANSEKLYLSLDKVNQTLKNLVEKNTQLESENTRVKEKNNKLNIKVTQLNKQINKD